MSSRARSRSRPRTAARASPAAPSPAKAPAAPAAAKRAAPDEFGGPVGALATMVFLPVTIYALLMLCDDKECVGWDYASWAAVLNAKRLGGGGGGSGGAPGGGAATAAAGGGACGGGATILSPACAGAVADLLWSNDAAAVVAGWVLAQVLLERLLPATVALGDALPGSPNGKRLRYRLNGHLAFWATLLFVGHGWPQYADAAKGGGFVGLGPAPLSWVYGHFLQLASASLALALALSIFLYARSFRALAADGTSAAPLSSSSSSSSSSTGGGGGAPLLAHGGNTGNVVYDFFMGRELNPRLGWLRLPSIASLTSPPPPPPPPSSSSAAAKERAAVAAEAPLPTTEFDLKFFCELRPGLIGWVVLNLGMAAHQLETMGRVTPEMVLVNVAQGLYVWDALYNERAILTTMDITTDGFGFMLAFGDLAWVPFTYTLQARYLATHDVALPTWQLAAIAALCALGYSVFRGANGEKDAFRRDPDSEECAHLRFIMTQRGRRLLVSGWWGVARKINYTGDWMMGLAWSLATGGSSVIPFFYPLYFAILLVHRAGRDDHACGLKYGEDWKRYKEHVPYVFIPGVF